jgi:hypothetical protein
MRKQGENKSNDSLKQEEMTTEGQKHGFETRQASVCNQASHRGGTMGDRCVFAFGWCMECVCGVLCVCVCSVCGGRHLVVGVKGLVRVWDAILLFTNRKQAKQEPNMGLIRVKSGTNQPCSPHCGLRAKCPLLPHCSPLLSEVPAASSRVHFYHAKPGAESCRSQYWPWHAKSDDGPGGLGLRRTTGLKLDSRAQPYLKA